MEYREYKPQTQLSAFIECYWSAKADQPPFREQESLIPDGTIELMFNFGDDYAQIRDGRLEPVKGSHIIGIRKQSLFISQTSRQNFFSIRFKPGGTYPFFKIPAYLFTNTFCGVEELLGKEYKELEEKLAETGSNERRVEITENYLLQKIATDNDYPFVKACSRRLLQGSSQKIQNLAGDFNTTYKTIERKFKRVIGLTPAELLKVRRFNQAVHTMYSCRYPSLSDVALASGYYDQSHFNREFKQLTSFTPRQFIKEQFTIVRVIQPALAVRLSKSYNIR